VSSPVLDAQDHPLTVDGGRVSRTAAENAVVPAPTVAVEDGQAAVTATFAIPGDYVLRATANDDRLSAERDVTVTVR